SPDGKTLAVAREDDAIRLWEVATGRERLRWDGNQGKVRAVAIAPDGRVVASAGEDHTVRLWAVATGEGLRRFQGHRGEVHGLAFSPDGRSLASVSADTTLLLWDMRTVSWGERPAAGAPRPNFEKLWSDLAGADAARAYRAIWTLVASEQSVAF